MAFEAGRRAWRLGWETSVVAGIALLALAGLLALGAGGAGASPSAAMNEPTTPILDDFDGRGLEDPLYQWGNWTTTSIDGSGPTLEILGGSAGHNEGDDVEGDSYRAVAVPPGTVEAYATIAGPPENNEDLFVYVNLQETGTPGWDGYRARWFHWIATDGLYLEKIVDGVATSLVPPLQIEPAVGDVILVRNTGGAIELWHKTGGAWQLRLSAADASFSGGRIGLGATDDSGGWSDFGGSGTTTPAPTPPDVPGTGLLDQFERANEDPLTQGGAWSETPVLAGGQTLEVLGNAVGQNEAETLAANSFRTDEIVGDAEVHARIAAMPDNNQDFFLYLHLQQPGTAEVDGYVARWFHWISTDGLYIRKLVDGVQTTIAGPLALDPAVGDTLLLRRFGLGLELWRKHGATWTKLLSTIDESFTSGHLGLGLDDEAGRWDDFGGGSLGAPPPAPPPPPSNGPPLERSRGICSGAGIHAIATSRCLSDPVNTLTGAFVTSTEDLSLPGTGVSFAWSRTYTSSDPTSRRLGLGWTDSYATSLDVEPDGDVVLHGDEGQVVVYEREPDGSFVGAPGSLSTLRAVAGGYELLRTDQVAYRFDPQGRLLSMVDRNGQGLTLAYDGGGRLTGITDADGRLTTLSYNASGLVSGVSAADERSVAYGYTDGRLSSFTDVRGELWRYTYDDAGRLASIVDPLDHVEVGIVYGADGRVQSQTDALGKTTTFAWDADTQTATVTDANGNAWKDDYDENVLVERVDPLGNKTTFQHDEDLNTAAVTSATGQTTSMSYDARGNLLGATAPASLGGVQKTFVYNQRNDPTRVTDARGTVTSYTYDADGNVERVVQGGTVVATYTYDAAGRMLTSTDGNSKTTTFGYDANGNVTSETDPLGNRTTYTYDDAGRVLTRVDPRGNAPGGTPANFTWRWTYNAAGQVLTERDPLGNVTSHTYDDSGNELTVTDAAGRTTGFAYDAANRLVSEIGPDPDGGGPLAPPVTRYTYDDVGNRLTRTDALERTTTFGYDAANRLISTTLPDPDGNGPLTAPVTTTAYDANGNVVSTVEPRGNVAGASPADFRTTFTYDAAGRLLTTADPLGNATTTAYDSVGNAASVRDANGHVTAFAHDAAGRVTTVTAPDGGVTAYTYDAAGNRLTRRDARGHVTTYGYDGAGRLVTETRPDPDGPGPKGPGVTTHTYDANGNLASTTDPNGNATAAAGDGRTTFTYDAADRLIGVDYSDSTPDVTFAYDAVGNRVSMTDGSGTEVRDYDGLTRLTSVRRGSNFFSYMYDAVGNLIRRTYPGGASTAYTYDGLDRIASVASGSQTTTYGYDVASHPTQTTLPSGNGHVESRVYDRAGRLTDVTTRRGTTTLASFVATLDGVGNPTQVVRTGALSQTQAYTYDPNDRIVSVCFQAGVCQGAQDPYIRWTYDAVGNRLTEQRPSGATSYTYDAADRLTQAGQTTYTYDDNGNQLSAGARTFTYDLANRLRTARVGSTTSTYSYDGDGIRLQTSTGSSSSRKTNFVWDVNHPLPQLALEQNGSGSTQRTYTYGARRLSTTSGSSTSYYHYDGLGSVANLTSSSGSRQWTYAYEPFGATHTEQRSGGSAPTNLMKFTGEYLDPTGLYHLRARQYDPTTGRFVSLDPVPHVSRVQGSAYAYVLNQPTVFSDPSGATLEPIWDAIDTVSDATSPAILLEPPLTQIYRLPCPARPGHPLRLVGRFLGGPYQGTHTRGNWQSDRAVDISVPVGTRVCAVFAGRIGPRIGPLNSTEPALAGLRLTIEGRNDHAYYAHLSRIWVKARQRVKKGHLLGLSGSANGSPHLHLALRDGDPTRYCRPGRILRPCY
jgi:RHS repeat-associated protein